MFLTLPSKYRDVFTYNGLYIQSFRLEEKTLQPGSQGRDLGHRLYPVKKVIRSNNLINVGDMWVHQWRRKGGLRGL